MAYNKSYVIEGFALCGALSSPTPASNGSVAALERDPAVSASLSVTPDNR